MRAAQQAVASLQTLGNATAQHPPKSATGGATGRATGSIKALAIKALRVSSAQRPVQQGCNAGATNRATEGGILLQALQRPSGLPWPEPEPGHLVVYSAPWKYACLWAIVSHFGVWLIRDSGGCYGLSCPDTMPKEAAQAAQDGLAELLDYIMSRLGLEAGCRG